MSAVSDATLTVRSGQGEEAATMFTNRSVVVIHNGANPADLPVVQSTKIELAIDLKTAKALELTIPQSVHLRADKVIQ